MACPDIDGALIGGALIGGALIGGALIGGAALEPQSFLEIIRNGSAQ